MFATYAVAVVAALGLGACGGDEGMENLLLVEKDVMSISEKMDLPPNLIPNDDLDLVEERALVEGWGQVLAGEGKIQLNHQGRYLCLTLPDSNGNGRRIIEGPCS